MYHGVPFLFLPFGNDQNGIASLAQSEGVGLRLEWQGITEQVLTDAINRIMTVPR